jgi:parvulin-like peptidyl-prolyl isomerase
MPMTRSFALALLLCGCGSLATGPSWTGGGMAVTGPLRLAAAEKKEDSLRRQRKVEPKEIGARHILVMHDESAQKPPQLHRTKDEARERAQKCLERVRAGEDFVKMVNECTDEPGGVERGGNLGVFKRELMVETFADAAFALKVGEVSELVETQFGFHIIQRTK